MKRAAALIAISAYVVLLTAAAMPAAHGAGAMLSFGPSSGSEAVGSTFTVTVLLDSGGGVGVNAADGMISFDPSLLAVQSVSKDSSVFNLWVNDPAYSNSAGTVTFSGGGTTAYTGSAGTVMSVVFKALKAGAASLKFDSASALAADGQGTNVLGGTGTASYALGGSAAPSPAPSPSPSQSSPQQSSASAPAPFIVSISISSPTHPDPTKWYADANPNFTWQLTPDVAGVSTAFDRNAATYPKRVSEGLISSKQYTNVGEGQWYFHVRFEDSLGNWSDPVTEEVQIDLTPPKPFTVTVQPGAGIEGRTVLQFQATDTVSGIDHYEVSFDGASSTIVDPNDVQGGAYTAQPILPGKHTVVVTAVDQAGNTTSANAAFEIPGITTPKITNYPATVIENSPIVLEGIADSSANVTVDVTDGNGKVISEGKMIADQSGHWLYAIEGGLPSGKYSLGISMVTTQGAVSTSTDKLSMDVLPAPFLDRFGLALIVLLIAIIAGLIVFGWYKKKLIDLKLAHVRRENEDIRMKTKAVFEALREEVDEKINRMEGGASQAQGEAKLEPENVLDAMRNALTVSESTIQKEVDDVDRALDDKG